MDTKIEVQTKMADKYQEENYQFMVEFVKLYAEDENKAKAQYYSKKLKFDITIPEGEA
jgi:5'-3' exoribonuclease 1